MKADLTEFSQKTEIEIRITTGDWKRPLSKAVC